MTKAQFNITNKSQEVSHFPAGDDKTAISRRESMQIQDTNDPQKKYRLGTVSKNISLEGLNLFYGANIKSQEVITLSSDVDQDP